jgi:hypothetical protein
MSKSVIKKTINDKVYLALSLIEAKKYQSLHSWLEMRAFHTKKNTEHLCHINHQAYCIEKRLHNDKIIEAINFLTAEQTATTHKNIKAILFELFIVTRRQSLIQSDTDLEILFQTYVKNLVHYPIPCIQFICQEQMTHNAWFPTLSNLRMKLDALLGDMAFLRQILVNKLEERLVSYK